MNYLKSLCIFCFAAIAACFTACGDDDDYTPEPSFSIPQELLDNGISFDINGGSTSFQVKTSSALSVSLRGDDTSWLSVASTGTVAGGYTVTVNAEPNVNEDARQAVIALFCESVPRSIIVKQAGNGALIPEPDPDDPAPAMEDLTAIELCKRMVTGINIGNTMEVPGGETLWGNPEVNKGYIAGLKALGFNAVRVPCSFDSHVSDSKTNTIDPAWLDRVDEVIGWIVAADMYAVLNIHWDGGWLEENVHKPFDEKINKKQHDYWTQIANKLNHYDHHLLFAGMNEPGVQNGSSATTAVNNIIAYQQTFIDAVRATGDNNAIRCLVVQGPSTDINLSVQASYRDHMPVDKVADKLVMEIHFYDPSDFTIMSNDGDWSTYVKYFWGADNHVSGSMAVRNASWGEESHVASQFKKMKTNYVDKGYPVIVGEYATSIRQLAENMDKHEASRAYWNEVVTREARNNGCVPFYWETGGDIIRMTGAAKCPYAIDGIMRGVAASSYPF